MPQNKKEDAVKEAIPVANDIIAKTIEQTKNRKLRILDRVSKNIIAVFYMDGKYYKKKKQKMRKVGDTFTFESGTYILDDKDAIQIGRKSYILYSINNPLPLSLNEDKNAKRNSKVLDVLVSKRTLKAMFGNPDKWYLVLAIVGLGAGISVTTLVLMLLAVGKLVLK